jgi:hypothetical protein
MGRRWRVGEKVAYGAFSVERTHTHEVLLTTPTFTFRLSNSDRFLNQQLASNVPLSQLRSHGLIGQTHSAKTYPTALRYIEGDVDEYSVDDGDILGTDFAYNRFQQPHKLGQRS